MEKKSKSKRIQYKSQFLNLGGRPILDFCNTLVFHGARREDRLQSPQQMGNFIKAFFVGDIDPNREQFDFLIRLRSLLRSYYEPEKSLTAQKSVNLKLQKFIESITFQLSSLDGQSLHSHLKVTEKRHKFAEPFLVDFFELNRILIKQRLKKCSNPNCSHLFYDNSKNNKRIWCSMKSCGNIFKARSFYRRNNQLKLK